MTKPEGIIFDLDNTLVETEKMHFLILQDMAKDLNIDLGEDFYAENYLGKDIKTIFISILAYMDYEPTEEVINRFIEERIERTREYISQNGVPLVKGAKEFLTELKNHNVPITIATSAQKELAELELFKAGIIDFFEKIVTVWEVEKPKPEPDVYIEAARILNANIKKCIIFEDSYHGLSAAKKAGAYKVAVKTSHPESGLVLMEADKIINNYTEITAQELFNDFEKKVLTKDS